MEFEFTKRDATVAKRFVEVHLKSVMEQLEEINKMTSHALTKIVRSDEDDILAVTHFNNIRMQIRVIAEFDEDEDRYLSESANCKFEIRNTEIGAFYKEHPYNVEYMENLKLNIWIDSLVNKYLICKCNHKLIEKDGWCKHCYPFVMEQPDVCCCCLENEGVWVKLDCNHTIHKYCFNKIIGRKCPLCRAEINPHSLIII